MKNNMKISTFGQHSFSPFSKNINIILTLLLFLCFGCGEESKVKNTCNNFIKGRRALDAGDSLLLKQVTEDSLFQLIMLHHSYQEMLDVPVISANLNISTKSTEIDGNCATCLMSGSATYKIHLCKQEDTWKVEGENGIYPDAEKILTAQKKITDYKLFKKEKPARDSVLRVLDLFFNGAKSYFKNQDLKTLKQVSNDSTVDFIQRLYSFSKQRTGIDLIINEMGQPNYMTVDVIFDSDKITCKFYKEEITVDFQKLNNSYIVTGINGVTSEKINNQILKNQYLNLLRALKLTRSEMYRSKDIY